MSGVNLVLVSSPSRAHDDLEAIAGIIRARWPEVRPFVVRDVRWDGFWLRRGWRPSCTVSWVRPKQFASLRGSVFEGRRLPKSTEYTLLRHCGLPVPDWRLLRAGDPAGIEGLGAYVVSKPNIGKQGADVLIRRADKVRWSPPKTAAAKRLTRRYRRRELIAQRFVYTGHWPVSYRIITLLGRAIMALRIEASHERSPLAHRAAFGSGGMSIVSSSKGCVFTFCDDPEIIALAERAHAAFPNHPLLGVDVLRDAETGRLFVAEVNSSGNVWFFTGSYSERLEGAFGLDLKAQFNAFETIAEVLAAHAIRWAR